MRGVELGSVGRGISVAPSRIGGFPAPRFEMGIKSIANPFKGGETRGFSLKTGGSSYIENRGPSLLEPNIGIIRNPEPKAPSQTISVANTALPSGAEAVDIVEKWLGISNQPQKNHYILGREHNEVSPQRIIEPVARPRDFIWKQPEVLPFFSPEAVVKSKIEPKIQPKSGQIEFSKSYPQGAILTELDKKSVQEISVGQNFEEEIILKEKVDEKPEVSEREEIEEWQLKDVLDEEVAEQRVYEISEAIDLAETEAKKEGLEEIEGLRILKFLRLHIGLISQIARKIRKDGSLDETLEELAARRFSSKNQAKAQTKELIAQKEPVRRGKEGKAVKEGAVERVFKYYFVKRSPGKEVVNRVVKKQIQTGHQTGPVQVQAIDVGIREPRIEDDADLAEVFLRKAA